MSRGALLVLEGCDRVGKSTQVKCLVQALNDLGIPAEARGFPDRTTRIGAVIDEFLSCKNDLSPEAVHLLFSANRWECMPDMKKKLLAGTTLVVDRYAASGAAYSAVSTNKKLSWCKEPDRGLPAPDFVALLRLDEEKQCERSGWANERFERREFQKKVAENFEMLKDEKWFTVEANKSVEDVHNVLLAKVLEVIEKVKNEPIKKLYES